MRLSIQHTRLSGENLSERFQRAAECGFSGVELATGAFPGPLSDSMAEIEQAMQASGLPVSSLCTSSRDDLVHPDRAEREQRLAGLVHHLKLADVLGALGVIALPVRRSVRMPAVSSESEEAALVTQLFVAQLRDSLKEAKGGRAAVFLEPLNRYEARFLRTVGHAAEICRSVDHPRAQVMADMFHMNIEEADIADSLTAVGQVLGHVHLADSNRSLPGLGHLEFDTPFRALRRSGFDGWLALECSVPGNPAETLPAANRFLREAWDRAGEG